MTEQEIFVLLEQLDNKAIRAMREGDDDRVAEINAQVEALRLELKGLQDAAAN